jgi:GNAT superfamily N-acetyltransferase
MSLCRQLGVLSILRGMRLESQEHRSGEAEASRSSGALRTFLRKAREVGLFYTVALGIRRALPARVLYVGRTILLEMRRDQERAAGDIRDGIRWSLRNDSELLTAFGHSLELVRRRLSAGDTACMLIEAERLLGYVWFHGLQHEDENLGVCFQLAPGEIWLFDAMIAPDHRGRGLYPRLLRVAAEDLWRRGLSRILIAVEASNRNSLQGHLAAGARAVGSVCGLRILGLTAVHHGTGFRVAWTGARGWLELSTHCLVGKP